ncbi:MAG: hypothetical protein ACR2NX_00470 [Chthoniobacterales bacterium]
MPRRKLLAISLALGAGGLVFGALRMTQDTDLTDLDVKNWPCLDKTGGSAKTEDGQARNRGKNRSPIDLTGQPIPGFDSGTFLRAIGPFDAQAKGQRRKDLAAPQLAQLAQLESNLVSLTGYLVLAYPGPPESTNCGDVDFHDWHLEVFVQPADHAPRIGDPTPIICEITPRTQQSLYRAGIRIHDLAGFIRGSDMNAVSTGHPARKIRLTGYLLWDDEHNGSADVGTVIANKSANGYHHPWRQSAWEIHPVLKIEPLEKIPGAPAPLPPARVPAAATATPVSPSAVVMPTVAPAAVLPPTPAPHTINPPPSAPRPTAAPQFATLVKPVSVKLATGETVLARGTKVQVVARGADTVMVRYLDNSVTIPVSSTDLR